MSPSSRPQTLADYAYERIEHMHRVGAIVEQPGTIYVGDWRVIVQGLLIFGQNQQAFLWVYEVVAVDAGVPTRRKYNYHFSYDGAMVFRYDRDPVQHPDMPEHKHLPPDRRIEWDVVGFQDVIDEVLTIVSEREADEALAQR